MSMEAILHAHFSRYPAMQIQDVYKLLHQAALGSEHAIANPEDAKEWLERELTGMGSGIDESAVDPISPDGQIARVHLRPFVSGGGNPETLLAAFIRTANEFHGNTHILEDYWKIAASGMRFAPAEMDEFIRSMREKDYPAVHHSAVYEKKYRPAYRVVLRALIDG